MIFFSYSSAQSLKKQYVQIWFLLASIVVDDIKLIYNLNDFFVISWNDNGKWHLQCSGTGLETPIDRSIGNGLCVTLQW